MRPRTTFATLLAVILLFTATLAAQTWHQGRIGYFEVTTDSGDGAAREVLQRMQIERAVIGQILHKPISTPGFVQMILVRDPASLTRAVSAFPVDGLKNSALSYRGLERNSIVLQTTQWESAQRALAMALLAANYPHTPRWFDVGFMRYAGTMQILKDEVEIGRAPSDDRSGDQWIPALQLMTGGNENDAQWQHESWLLVHWLITNSRLDEAGKYFYLTLSRQTPPQEAIFSAFNEDATALDRDLRAYESDVAKHIQTLPTPSLQATQMFDVSKVSATDAQVAIASAMLDDHEVSESAPAAMNLLSTIMHNTPENAAVQRALAYGYFLQHDSVNAVEHARRAIALKDSDAMMHFIMAVGLNGGDSNTIRTNMADVRLGMELNEALRLNPAFPPAFELRGLALMSADKNDAGLKDLGHAAALRPRNDAYLLHLGQAHADTGDWGNARMLFLAVKDSPDNEIASAANAELKTGKRLKKEQKHWNEQGISASNYQDMTDPRWKLTPQIEARDKAADQAKTPAGPDTRKVMHLDGQLTSVDCSEDPGAVLSVSSRGNDWKMKVADRTKVLLIGKDRFSCEWKDLPVSINFKSTGGVTGDVVSVEVH